MLDIDKTRADFPMLQETLYGKPLVYLDNAATTHKPRVVLDRLMTYYMRQNSNCHRGAHYLSERAGEAYAAARESVRSFLHARHTHEIIFTRGATESINLAAGSFGREFVKGGDEILITQMEHHSNIVPWQMMCEHQGATLKVLPIDKNGLLELKKLDGLITEKTRLLCTAYVSNALGTVNPIREIIAFAHSRGVPVLVDAAQAVQHMPVDVQALDCDFLVFSGHKMYAETGIGVLYGKERWLEAMPPYQTGGGMITDVNLKKTTCAELPLKFEAGSANTAGALTLQAAIEYLQQIGLAAIGDYEQDLIDKTARRIASLDGVTVYGDSSQRCGVVSFNLDQAHPYDVGMILDKYAVAVRTGMHCAQPLMDALGIPGTVRVSIALYNTDREMDQLMAGLKKAQALLCPSCAAAG